MISLRHFALAILPISWFFWAWALVNSVTKSYVDLGVVSFASVAATASYIIFVRKQDDEQSPSSTLRVLFTASHVLVAINYFLGAALVDWRELGLLVYFLVFGVLWCLVAGYGFRVMNQEANKSAVIGEPVENEGSDNLETDRTELEIDETL